MGKLPHSFTVPVCLDCTHPAEQHYWQMSGDPLSPRCTMCDRYGGPRLFNHHLEDRFSIGATSATVLVWTFLLAIVGSFIVGIVAILTVVV